MRYAYFDIHSHLNFPQFDADRDDVVAVMEKDRVGTITVGTGLQTSREAVALAEAHGHLYATIGIHPTDTHERFDENVFAELSAHPKVVAVGECGLDYYRDDAPETKTRQRELFLIHLTFARTRNLPLMIHARPSRGTQDAYEDILDILQSTSDLAPSVKTRGNVHFFAGSQEIASRFLDLGFSLSFDGPITFAPDYDDVVKYVPSDRIMAETDSPYAAPVPFRGKRCDPTMVRFVAERIARIRGENPADTAVQLVQNACVAFGIPQDADA